MKKMMAVALASLLVSSAAYAMDINDNFSVTGLVEVEAGFSDNGDTTENDIALATAELAVDGTVREGVSGHLLYAWDDEAGEFSLDEALIAIEKDAFYLNAGKQIVPFGMNETDMISDPLTLDLSEIHDTAITGGWSNKGLDVFGFAFNGDLEEDGESNETRTFGFGATYEAETDAASFLVGGQYINRMAEADSVSDALGNNTLTALPAGVAVQAAVSAGSVTVRAEGVMALDETEIDGDENIEEVAAYAVEGVLGTSVLGKDATFALGYQWTDKGEALELPETRVIATAGFDLGDGLGFAAEYQHDTNYGNADDADALTLQLALEF